MEPYIEYIEHTADIGFTVRAPQLSQLFSYSARGMFDLIADTTNVPLNETRVVNVQADDIVSLMHGWLSELLFVHTTEHLILVDFPISELTEQHISSITRGDRFHSADPRLRMEIKAVTMHNLEVNFDGTCWKARIIFDI